MTHLQCADLAARGYELVTDIASRPFWRKEYQRVVTTEDRQETAVKRRGIREARNAAGLELESTIKRRARRQKQRLRERAERKGVYK